MLPTTRRDRYDNAKRRRGGILKTLLRKEGRLIRQFIVVLLVAVALLLLLRWLPRGQILPQGTPAAVQDAKAGDQVEHFASKLPKGEKPHTQSVEAAADPEPTLPKSPDEAMPRFNIGGKRFLPINEASEEEEPVVGQGADSTEAEVKYDLSGLKEDGGTEPWSNPAELKRTKHPREEAKEAQLADLMNESGKELESEKELRRERLGAEMEGTVKQAAEESGFAERKTAIRAWRGHLDKVRGPIDKLAGAGKEGSETVESVDPVKEFGEDLDGETKISDTGGLIRALVEHGARQAGSDASGSAEGFERDEPLVLEKKQDRELDSPVRTPMKTHSVKTHSVSWEDKRQRVVAAFQNAWDAYKKHAWGYDELKPVSQQGEDGLGGLGATIVDALDTAMIMGLGDIVEDAGNWVDEVLPSKLGNQGYVNLFETTIRVLGGLLSAYHLSGGGGADLTLAGGALLAQGRGPQPEVYLKRAEDLGGRLMAAFTSPSAVPYSDVHLASKVAKAAHFDGGSSSTAEVATLGMEFCYLSRLSGNPEFCDAALGVIKHIKKQRSVDGLVPIFISPLSGHFDGNNIRLGSRGDSYYEYLLKVWMQAGGAEGGPDSLEVEWLRDMWDESMGGVKSRLLGSSVPSGLLFVGERPDGLRAELSPKMDHLVCFLAGALALGATKGRTVEEAQLAGDFSEVDKEDLRIAKELAHTCYVMYEVTVTGLAPEIAYFNTGGGAHGMPPGNPGSKYLEDIIIQPLDRHNLLRPETVESLFVLYRITGDEQYREWGWDIFTSLELHAKVASGGYSSLHDITKIPPPTRDKMETFFLGETLKYLYLLFSDVDVLPLDKFVFNTEAHPLPVWKSNSKEGRTFASQKHERDSET